jgi:hypothetical protein
MRNISNWNPSYHKPGNNNFNDEGLRAFCRHCRAGHGWREIADLMGICGPCARHRFEQWTMGRLSEYNF